MKAIVTGLAAILTSQLAFAHGDHPPRVAKCETKKCTKDEVMKAAPAAVKIIASKDPKKSAWASVAPTSVEEKSFAKGPEYVVTFEDKTRPAGEQTLYMFVTVDGYLNGSNYTGK